MGCGTPREKLEDEMMVYKLERMAIQMEKENEFYFYYFFHHYLL